MNNEEMMQAILGQLEKITGRLDGLEAGQKDMNRRLDTLEEGQKSMRAEMKDMRTDIEGLKEGQKSMRADIEDLKEGQKSIRRDVARVERKVDRMGNDIGDTLAIITETTDYELSKLREAK